MHEDDIVPMNNAGEDELDGAYDEDMEYEDESDVRAPIFAANSNRDRPMSVPETLGVDPARIQSLKAAFDGDAVAPSPHRRIYASHAAPPSSFEVPEFSPSKRFRSERMLGAPVTFTPRPVAPLPLVAPLAPKSAEFSIGSSYYFFFFCTHRALPDSALFYGTPASFVPLKQSLSCQHFGDAKDSGLYLGRSFRVGWGPNGTLIRPGASVGSLKVDQVIAVRHLPSTPAASNVRSLQCL
jgi:nuclear pore complex protein Nup98-Nup96